MFNDEMFGYRNYFIMKLSYSTSLVIFFLFPFFSQGQSESQLRNPEFLIEQYNQLVAKHNALIEKTRVIIAQKTKVQPVDSGTDDALRQTLNEALAKAATLENQLSKIRQEGLRTTTSNQYLDDTNARLRRQLQEVKADEQDLAQRNKELTVENRRLTNTGKSFDAQEKSNYAKIRELELGKTTIQRRANNILAENNTLSAENKKIKSFAEKVDRENAALKQKIAGLDIDIDSNEARLGGPA